MAGAREIARAIREGVMAEMIARGMAFDQETYAKAYAKYRRMCNQFSDFDTYTAEQGIDGAIGNVISFFAECKAGVTTTENRERSNNFRRQG